MQLMAYKVMSREWTLSALCHRCPSSQPVEMALHCSHVPVCNRYDTQWSGGLAQGWGSSAGEVATKNTRACAGPGAMPHLLVKGSMKGQVWWSLH